MTKGTLAWAMAAVIGGAALLADRATAETPATQPSATTKPAGHHRKLVKPYSEMKSLTSQQEDQIAKIHEDALEQTNKIREKERDDISALLTPEQQAELTEVEKEGRKTTTPRRKGAAATTKPAM